MSSSTSRAVSPPCDHTWRKSSESSLGLLAAGVVVPEVPGAAGPAPPGLQHASVSDSHSALERRFMPRTLHGGCQAYLRSKAENSCEKAMS